MRLRYFGRKLGFYLVAAWVAITINFFLPRLIPGNPVEVILARQEQTAPSRPGEAAALTRLLGLGSGNIFDKYVQYLDSLVHLRMGLSVYEFPVPVSTVIRQAIGWTLILVGTATVISFVVGIGLGVVVGWRRGSLAGHAGPLHHVPHRDAVLLARAASWSTCSPSSSPCCRPRAGTTRPIRSAGTGSSWPRRCSTRCCPRSRSCSPRSAAGCWACAT